jgi:Na+/H+-translocating membrane pyrophosphatase
VLLKKQLDAKVENQINNYFLSILSYSTVSIFLSIIFFTFLLVPEDIYYENIVINWWKLTLTLINGLLSGYLICYSTYYYTCKSFQTVIDLAEKSIYSSSANIIFGLALGNWSTVIPVLIIAVTVMISNLLCGINGIAFSSFGVILNLPTIFLFSIFGPLSDVSRIYLNKLSWTV